MVLAFVGQTFWFEIEVRGNGRFIAACPSAATAA
jgi:hypothetical protein